MEPFCRSIIHIIYRHAGICAWEPQSSGCRDFKGYRWTGRAQCRSDLTQDRSRRCRVQQLRSSQEIESDTRLSLIYLVSRIWLSTGGKRAVLARTTPFVLILKRGSVQTIFVYQAVRRTGKGPFNHFRRMVRSMKNKLHHLNSVLDLVVIDKSCGVLK